MMLMCSSHSSNFFHGLAKAHPGKLGWLLGPSSWRPPRAGLPYALDNDAFIAWKNQTPWDEVAWLGMLKKCVEFTEPAWCLVPDVVADKVGTIDKWHVYSPEVARLGWLMAFAVQDGMTPKDVPFNASVVFVGGTTQWKWRTIPMWCDNFPRVHVGRCGTSAWKLRRLQQLGVESCDGTGFFRATSNGRESRQLQAWLHDSRPHPELAL